MFIAGCGRFFEGIGEEMDRALTYLGTLPNETVVHNGHEYTKSSLAFAKSIDPENKALARLSDIVQQNVITTGITTIGDEKEWNVFMRLDSDAVRSVNTFTYICRWLQMLILSTYLQTCNVCIRRYS